MPLLLLICLTLACLPIDWPAPWFQLGPTGSAAITAATVACLLTIAKLLATITIVQVRRNPDRRDTIGHDHTLRRFCFVFLNLGGLAAVMLIAGWGWTIKEWLTHNGRLLAGAELAILAPYLITLIGSWTIFYDAEYALFSSGPERTRREFWSRGGYVFFVLRHHALLVFLPVGLIIVQFGAIRQFPDLVENPWAKAATVAMIFAFILAVPSVVPLVLGLRRMPAGPIRSRLEAAARRIGVRYRNLYVWDTHKNLATAMVAGLVPRFRHVVFSDLLLEALSDDEIEGVFGHEAGHVKHGHLMYYAAFLLLSFLTLGAAYRLVEDSIGDTWLPKDAALVFSVVATGTYLFVVFGFLSRRCERQADVFGCRALSCGDPACSGHTLDTKLVQGGNGLCRTGVETFARALERVEAVNGMSRSSPSDGGGTMGRLGSALRFAGVLLSTWQHSTIAKRAEFLRSIAENPDRARRFQVRVTLLRWAFMILLLIGVASIVLSRGWYAVLDGT